MRQDIAVIETVAFSVEEVRRVLSQINPNKSPGPDRIPGLIFKELSTELSKPLSTLFELSMKRGRLPSQWKTANLVPLHKGGSKMTVVLSKIERHALKELRADNDLVIVPADKGRSTVVLDRTDYNQNVKSLLDDRQSYVPCESNPMKTLTREINATLLAMENSGAISPIDRRMAKAQKTPLTRFHSHPKVHKEGAPLRPIVSLKGTPTYGPAKWLFQRLKFLTSNSNTTVRSLTQFLEKLRGDLAVESIELLLREKYDETENRLGHAQIIQLLKFCLKTYFTFDETIYEQVKGTPMGSPISGLITEAVLQRLNSLVFRHHRPKF
nr:unnamed protein product [Spirometra erinaceieuropaei]